MAGVNKVVLVGNLGKDPEAQVFEGGRRKVTFSLATSETYKDRNGEKQTKTEWHNVVLWGAVGDIAERYLKKGRQVYIEGKLTHRSYEDKEGNTRYVSEVQGRDITLLGGAANNGNPGFEIAPDSHEAPSMAASFEENNPLPF